MAVKANALVIETSPGTTSGTFQIRMLSVYFPTDSLGYVTVDNMSPSILPLTFQNDLIAAVKSHWSLGLLDSVRLIGSDIL